MPDNVIDPNMDHWFTDGLGINDCFGAGIFGPLYNYRESVPMGSLSMMFSAKVMAILKCTELLLTKNLMRRRIHICCDSRVAVAALVKTTAELSIVWEYMQVLGKLNKLYKVTLGWIPRYQGISVNEEADRLVKEGAIEVPPNQFTAVPFSVGNKLVKKQLELMH